MMTMNRIRTFFVFALLFGLLSAIPDTYASGNTEEIYVGVSEIQRSIIARDILKEVKV